MKLQVFAVAVLALAGAAFAQSDHATSGGVNPVPYGFYGGDVRPQYSNVQEEAAYSQKVKAFRTACAAERRAQCEGRTRATAVWACIRIRRSKLAEPCRASVYAVERAAADANLSF